ncbi:sugar phosphate isomerase/epimerase family protein [Romboutsia sp.]|uniref:sugar phosphate isomerase/epimerase family protein n=1 Tax=Romboutsia sp. TaxID=1965302 RepID=UPI003F2E04AC
MRLGIGALLFNLDEALEICTKIKEINHLEIGIDNLYECKELYKYKDKFEELKLSIGIHLPMELNTCENIEYIRDAWLNFIDDIRIQLNDFDIKYFNMHLGYVITNRLNKNRTKYLDKSIIFLDNIKAHKNTKISIENTYSNCGDYSNVGNISQDFEYIFSKARNDIKFCYDTGHDLINSSNYIEALKEKIDIVHLSDNDGIEDTHIGIGIGILPNLKIKEVLNLNPEYLILEIGYEYIEETLKKIESIKKEV